MNRGEYGDLRRYGTSKGRLAGRYGRRRRAQTACLAPQGCPVVTHVGRRGHGSRRRAGRLRPHRRAAIAMLAASRNALSRARSGAGAMPLYGEGRYGQYGEGRYRGMRPESQQRYVAPLRDPGRDSRGNWHQGGVSRYGDARLPTRTPCATNGEPAAAASRSARRAISVPMRGSRKICASNLRIAGFDVSEVEVTVAEGLVTLGGEVGERADKYGIEEIADGVFGVREVDNQIRLRVRRACREHSHERGHQPSTTGLGCETHGPHRCGQSG
ncbi:BON domain-containing protein [Cupriavidus basilensis]